MHLDRNIRGGARRQAAGPPGLEHLGGCGPKPWTETSGDEGERPRTRKSRTEHEGGEESGEQQLTQEQDPQGIKDH